MKFFNYFKKTLQCQSLYFLLFSLSVWQISTVGYGDITLKTQVGQLVAMIAIILALTILPVQIGRITYLASRRYAMDLMKGCACACICPCSCI